MGKNRVHLRENVSASIKDSFQLNLDNQWLDLAKNPEKTWKGFSLAKSNEYSMYISDLFFDDPDSVSAKKFQDCNSI